MCETTTSREREYQHVDFPSTTTFPLFIYIGSMGSAETGEFFYRWGGVDEGVESLGATGAGRMLLEGQG
jgi:hypothetical protein